LSVQLLVVLRIIVQLTDHKFFVIVIMENMDRVFQKVEGIIVRKVVGETILVPISGNLADMQRIFALNPVAEFIWERVDGMTPLSDIYKGILNHFEIDQDQAEKDLVGFIDELKTAKLVL